MIIGLCEIYLRSVDLPFKILHAPTLRAYMREERTYLNYRPGSAAVEALSFGVYLAAVTSLTEQECYGHFGLSRETLCQTYCASLERALAQTNFVTTRDVTVLQAFMLYLSEFNLQDLGFDIVQALTEPSYRVHAIPHFGQVHVDSIVHGCSDRVRYEPPSRRHIFPIPV